MKTKITYIAILAVFVAVVVMLVSHISSLRNERDVLYVNNSELIKRVDATLMVTQAQLSQIISQDKRLDSILQEGKIKQKHIQYITKTEYIYKVDTLHIPLRKDSINTYSFSFKNECLQFGGKFDPIKLSLDVINPQFNEELYHIGYLKKKNVGRKFLFFNIKKKYIELHTESKCGEVKVEHLKVIE